MRKVTEAIAESGGIPPLCTMLCSEEVHAQELAAVVIKQNAAILAAMQEQSRATERQTRAIERQTLAIKKLAAPGRPARESGKRKRVEGTSADAGNEITRRNVVRSSLIVDDT